MVDERGTAPVVVLDEAQHLSDSFLVDLSGFLNFAFDSRDLFTLWLVGQPRLRARLGLQHYAALQTRLAAKVHLEAFTKRDLFPGLLRPRARRRGCEEHIIADSARDLLSAGVEAFPARWGRSCRALDRAREGAELRRRPGDGSAIAEEADP
jgi:type II secretory pathway predicted ATPase ExeA